MFEAEMTDGESVVLVVDSFSSYTTPSTYSVTITEGNCPGAGATCVTEDGTDGVYDCDGICGADGSGDDSCDTAFYCEEFEFDGGDCEDPEIGDPCTTTTGSVGITDCDGACGSEWSLGGSTCDLMFDCEELEYDMGACLSTGDECTLDDDTAGVYDCSKMCVADTRGDTTCDDAFDCLDAEYDLGDCEAPLPGEDCTTSTGGVGLTACDGSCSSYPGWWGDSICDSIFRCEEMDWDMGACEPDFGESCDLEDGSTGIYDCEGGCSSDTRGDTICDDVFECADAEYDMGDCEMPEIGEECVTEFGYSGYIDCDFGCTSASSLGGTWCDASFDCAEMSYDGGACVELGDPCITEDGDDGVHGCGGDCVLDTRGDGICDDAFDCIEGDWDLDDCDGPSCGETDLGSELGDPIASGLDTVDWGSAYEGSCGYTGGKETTFLWTPPSSGTFCLDTFGSTFDTVIRVFDTECDLELTCDDDGSEWPGYPGDWTSMVEYEGTEGESVVLMVDSYSSSTTGSSWELTIAEGGCADSGGGDTPAP